MAKKKQAEKPVDHAEAIETEIRNAVTSYQRRTPAFAALPEREYLQTVDEALDTYAFGIRSRLEEIGTDEDE